MNTSSSTVHNSEFKLSNPFYRTHFMNIALYTQFVCDAVNEKDKGAGLFFILQIIITASSALFLCRL